MQSVSWHFKTLKPFSGATPRGRRVDCSAIPPHKQSTILGSSRGHMYRTAQNVAPAGFSSIVPSPMACPAAGAPTAEPPPACGLASSCASGPPPANMEWKRLRHWCTTSAMIPHEKMHQDCTLGFSPIHCPSSLRPGLEGMHTSRISSSPSLHSGGPLVGGRAHCPTSGARDVAISRNRTGHGAARRRNRRGSSPGCPFGSSAHSRSRLPCEKHELMIRALCS